MANRRPVADGAFDITADVDRHRHPGGEGDDGAAGRPLVVLGDADEDAGEVDHQRAAADGGARGEMTVIVVDDAGDGARRAQRAPAWIDDYAESSAARSARAVR